MARIVSAAQPSGQLHIGNWLGAIKQWVALQDEHECIYCIVDLHSITVQQDPAALRRQTRELAAWYVALGLDPARVSLVVQSHVPQHAELAWLLNCVTPLGWLYRMTQFKAKSEAKDSVGTGLLAYPVLMAADILVYDADIVPVGADQAQHLELCRDIAERFHSLYGETFRMPATRLPSAGARIMGLDDPAVKMSKSEPGPRHAVYLADGKDVIRKKLRSAVTDAGSEVRFDDAKPGVTNLLTIYQCVTGLGREAIEAHFAGKLYGKLKDEVADVLIEALTPVQERYRALSAEAGELDAILRAGADRVRPIAERTVTRAKERMGVG